MRTAEPNSVENTVAASSVIFLPLWWNRLKTFLTFPACFSILIFFSNLNYNCSSLRDMRNLQEQVKKAFCYQKLFWPFTAWINCSSDLKKISSSWPSALNFKSFSQSLEDFFLTVGQNNFGNKTPFKHLKDGNDLLNFYKIKTS